MHARDSRHDRGPCSLFLLLLFAPFSRRLWYCLLDASTRCADDMFLCVAVVMTMLLDRCQADGCMRCVDCVKPVRPRALADDFLN